MNEKRIQSRFEPKDTGGLVSTDGAILIPPDKKKIEKTDYCSQCGANSFRKTKIIYKKHFMIG